MTPLHSDALIFFGATGDLAYKKIFPALQAMVKRLCFAWEDYVEEAWRIVDPVLKAGTPVGSIYENNTKMKVRHRRIHRTAQLSKLPISGQVG